VNPFTISATVPSIEWAKSVALAFLDAGRPITLQPGPDDHWHITVEHVDNELFNRLVG
jgi:hypothetical protein